MINPRYISQNLILEDLKNFVKNEGEWREYFEGGAGAIILELLASVLADRNYYYTMLIRESSLETAQMESSIVKLAINKGIYRPGAKAMILDIKFIATSNFAVDKYEVFGSYKSLNLIALEPGIFKAGSQCSLKVAIGWVEEFKELANKNEAYYVFAKQTKGKYIAQEIQDLAVAGNKVEILTKRKPLYDESLKNTALAIYDYYGFKLIFGDGILGYKVNFGDEIDYKILTFDDNVFNKFSVNELSFLYHDKMDQVSFDVVQYPSGYMDKEILRRIALRASPDGRWVEAKDYEDGLLYEFFDLLYDVYLEDLYPSENLWLLPKRELKEDELEKIKDYIYKRKSASADIKIRFVPREWGKDVNFFMLYTGVDSDEMIRQAIDEVTSAYLNKLFKEETFFSAADLAVEITRLLPRGKIYAVDLNEGVQIKAKEFIKNLHIDYARKDS